MIYVNFLDKNSKIFTDKSDYNFLVKGYGQKKIINVNQDDIYNLMSDTYMKCSFRLYSLYDNETVREDLSDYVLEDGNLNIEYKSGVRRRLDISIFNEKHWLPSPLSGFLWKGSKFKLELIVCTESAEYICPAGIFILKNFVMNHENIKNKIKLEMVDKFGGLDGTVGGKISDTVYIPRGSKIVEVVKGLLRSEKFKNTPFDTKTPLFPSYAYNLVTPHSIDESSSSTLGALIIKLLKIANLDVYYDEYGRMCVETMRENMLVDSQPSLWTFSSEGDTAYNFHSLDIDFQKVENVVVVEGANINGDIVSARAENTNPKSPTNIMLFESNPYKVTDENISSDASAMLRAEYELFKRSLLPISQEFSTILIPTLDVNKVVTIDDPHCGLKNARFLINSIAIPISGIAKMTLKISNIEEVAFSG